MRFATLLITSLFLFSMASSTPRWGEVVRAERLVVHQQTSIFAQEPSGLRISGTVRLENGQGLAGVTIYQVLAMYLPGNRAAITGPDGFYRSAFTEIPSIETVRVYSARACYTFLPEYEVWMHYGGSYEKTIDFTAFPAACFRYYLPFHQN